MTDAERAKIFNPYAALKGFEEGIHARNRVTVPKPELGEDAQIELDRRLRALVPGALVRLRYYRDGQCLALEGRFRRLREEEGLLELENRRLPLTELLELELVGGE